MSKKQKNKKKKKLPFIYKLFSSLLALITVLFVGSIIYLNVLNFLLLIIALIFIIFISSFTILLMTKSRKKKTGFCLSIILILIYSFLSFYILKTTDFLSKLNLNYKTYNYSVVVLKTSPYQKLKDINGLNIGYYADESPETTKALDKFQKKVELEPTPYEDNHTLANELLDEKVDAILIENSHLEMLNENIEREEGTFKDSIKTIYTFQIIVNTGNIAKDINVTKKPFNIYVSGIDTFGEISSVSRSDVNMIITVNPETRQILLTSIPRDYYVKLHNKTGYRDKLTHAGLYGVDMSIETLEDLLDIEINYYVKVNFTSVIDIVNAIGGVKVYSDYTFTSLDNYNYTKGYNQVNGEQALSFARERKAFAAGDRQRVKNQQAVFKAIFEKCTSKSIITKYSKLLDSLQGKFVTNMSMARLTSLIRMQLSKNYEWNITSNSLEGGDGSNYTYSAPSVKAYVMVPKEESVMYAKELINKVFEGEVLDEDLMDEVSKQVHEVTKNNPTPSQDDEDDDKNASKEPAKNTTTTDEGELKIKLVRESVTIKENETYVYYPYTATYNGKDVTNDPSIKESFSIDGKTFADYEELILYIKTNLKPGKYNIIYKVTYKNQTKTLTQLLTIEANDNYNQEPNTDPDDSSSNNNGSSFEGTDEYIQE